MNATGTVLTLISILFSIFFTLKPVTIKWIYLNTVTAPLLGVILLLATLTINFVDIGVAITGTLSLRPYAIVILFISLAYLCLSLDNTGILRAFATRLSHKSSSYTGLFLVVFIQSALLTVFTSNDIVVLTLTPIIAQLCIIKKLNHIPFMLAQFFAANTWSTIFSISNPTNLIVAEAFQLSFVSYLKWMCLPTIAGGLALLATLRFIYRQEFATIQMEVSDQYQTVPVRHDAARFSIFCLLGCILLLILAPILNLDVAIICLVFGVLTFLSDLITDIYSWKRHEPVLNRLPSTENILHVDYYLEEVIDVSPRKSKYQKMVDYMHLKFPTTLAVCHRMPWSVIPFIFCMFIMVKSLDISGFTGDVSVLLGKAVGSSVFGAAFGLTCISAIACNLMNNQPMTILFTSTIQHPNFLKTLIQISGSEIQADKVLKASLFGVVMGSNYGANLTFVGALAGLLWNSILCQYKMIVPAKEFFIKGVFCVAMTILASCIVISLEIIYFP
jgi:arsenical pump membrane protein